MNGPARDIVFISHATPEDNEFVNWLGARLIGLGYNVWADVFELKGGTPFWKNIEEAIRQKALNVIYVASTASVDPNRKGVRDEFAHGQTATHPKDGLFLYGPPSVKLNPKRMEVGVIGTEEGLRLY